jgi:hypothetical protein
MHSALLPNIPLLLLLIQLMWLVVGLLRAEDVRIPLQYGTQQLRLRLRQVWIAVILVPVISVIFNNAAR